MNKAATMVHTLRSQSLETRKAILIIGSFGITALIALIWITTMAFATPKESPIVVAPKPIESPFTIIKDSVVEMYATASKGFDSASTQ